MKLPIAYYGHPILRRKCDPVTAFDEKLEDFVADLLETMKAYNGLGIAAPQVFKSIAVFITAPPFQREDGTWATEEPRLFVNPEILSISDEVWVHEEGCLSIPKVYGPVPRPLEVRIRYQDIEGAVHHETLREWEARTFLHENDHINGVLFPDRMEKNERKKLDDLLRKIKKKGSNKNSE